MFGCGQASIIRPICARMTLDPVVAAGRRSAVSSMTNHNSRSTVATLESVTGGAVARAFWKKCDAVFDTGEGLAPSWDDIQQHVQAGRALTAAARRRPGPRRRAAAGTTHLQALRMSLAVIHTSSALAG